MKNSIIDFSEIDVSESSTQTLNERLAFICRELRYNRIEIEELKKEKFLILQEIEKRYGE